jgi:Zn-dependent protease with chaperone function
MAESPSSPSPAANGRSSGNGSSSGGGPAAGGSPGAGSSSGGGGGRRTSGSQHRSRRGRQSNSGRNGSGASGRSVGKGGGGSNARRSGSRSPDRSPVPARDSAATTAVAAAAAAAASSAASEAADRLVAENRRRARWLALLAGLVPGLVVGAVLAALGLLIVAAAAFVVITAVVAAVVWRGATSFVLSRIGARPARPSELPRLANVVDGLCATFGVPVPDLMVVNDAVPNACALGRDPSSAVLVVTTGLLGSFGLIETEGVMAHELAHVKRCDTVLAQVAVLVLSPWTVLFGRDRLLHRAVGRGRGYEADQLAVTAVRYPPGLRDALAVMASAPPPGPASVFSPRRLAVTRWLWVDPMVGRRPGTGPDADTEGELDATSVRIAALDEW